MTAPSAVGGLDRLGFGFRHDAAVRQTVLRTGSVTAKRLPMLGSAVALVLLETVDGMAPAEGFEQAVAMDLRDDRCRRDRRRQRIAVNERKLRQRYAGNADGVDEQNL